MRKRTFSILSSAFAATALLLALIGSIRCNFIKFTDQVGEEEFSIKFGPWYHETLAIIASVDGIHVHKSCHPYADSVNIDTNWKICRTAIIIAGILGFVFIFLNIVWTCFYQKKGKNAGWEGIEYFVIAIFQGVTLLFLNSAICPDKCSISTGGICVIVSTLLWLLAAATNCTARAAVNKGRYEAEPLIGVSISTS